MLRLTPFTGRGRSLHERAGKVSAGVEGSYCRDPSPKQPISRSGLGLLALPAGFQTMDGVGRWQIIKQVPNSYTENSSEGLHPSNRRILGASLDPADVSSVDAGFEREPFLRKTSLDTKSPEVRPEENPSIHVLQTSIRGPTIDGLVIPYFYVAWLLADRRGPQRAAG